VARGEHGIGRDDAQFFLPLKGDFALPIPAVGELALVLVDPLSPAELENAYYRQTQPRHPVGSSESK